MSAKYISQDGLISLSSALAQVGCTTDQMTEALRNISDLMAKITWASDEITAIKDNLADMRYDMECQDATLQCQIDALDINSDAISILKKKYEDNSAVVVRETDTLLDEQLDLYSISQLWLKQTDTLFDKQLDMFSSLGGHYTKVIGNPPYGAWQDYEKRDVLKKKFAGHYVKETYSLLLLRCISVLRMNGRLSFIIPDTYLFLNMHSRLRELIQIGRAHV